MAMEESAIEKPDYLKKTLWFIFKVLLAVAIIYFLVGKHYHDFLDALKQFKMIWLLPAALLYLLHLVVGAWRWDLLIKVLNIKVGFIEAFALTMKSFFFSLVIPGGAIGGDVAKIGFLSLRTPRGHRFEGAFTVLMDRIVGMIALFSITVVVAVICMPVIYNLEKYVQVIVVILIAGSIAGLAAGCGMFFHRQLEKIRPIGYLLQKADHYTKGKVSRLTAAMDLYRSSYKTVIFTTIVSIFLIHLNMVAIVYFLTRGLGIENLSCTVLLGAVIIGNIAGLLPITVSGVGPRDYLIMVILAAGGVSRGGALAIPILYTALILTFNVSGGLFFIFGGKKSVMPEDLPSDDEPNATD